MRLAPRQLKIIGALIVAIAALGVSYLQNRSDVSSDLEIGIDDAPRIAQAFEAQTSDLWVESHGTVDRILKDDDEGSRHQRFIVILSNGHSLLISHNIDLAPRIPVNVGDEVGFRGEYEWNPKGGVVHWTHHDPAGRRAGGWIRHGFKTYE